MPVEARRITGEALARRRRELRRRGPSPEEAERRCRRALMEEWVGRETAVVPPAAVAPGARPGRRVRLDHDGRLTSLRLTSTADAGARTVEAVRDRRRRLRAGARARARAAGAEPVVYGPPSVAFLDLPQLRESVPGAPAARRRLRRALAGPGRGLAQPGRGRLRARHHARPAGTHRARSSPTSTPGRRRASTSATSPSSISPSARSRASPTSRSSAAPTRWRWRRRPASGRCCSSASPS